MIEHFQNIFKTVKALIDDLKRAPSLHMHQLLSF